MKTMFRTISFDEWSTVKLSRRLFSPLYRILFSWRTARRGLFAIAVLATLVALFYTVENWRGRRAWMAARRALEAHGETLDIAQFVPPPIPDEQNFAMAPPWSNAPGGDYSRLDFHHGVYEGAPHLFVRAHDLGGLLQPPYKAFGNMFEGLPADLSLWQKYYRDAHANSKNSEPALFPVPDQPGDPAEDVLLAFSPFNECLAQMREAARRPGSRFPVRYEDGFKMVCRQYGPIQAAAQVLRLRALAQLKLGRADAAFEDVKLQFRLAAAIQNEPLFLAHELRAGIILQTLADIWQGAAQHRWSDRHLAEFQRELEKLDFLADYDRGMRFNRFLAFQALEYMERTRDPQYFAMIGRDYAEEEPPASYFSKWAKIYRYMPAGWFDQNAAAFESSSLALGDCRSRSSSSCVDLEAWQQRLSHFERGPFIEKPYRFLATASLVFPANPERSSQKFIYSEAFARMARVACALERYRLVHGSYPEKLAALAPQFLPDLPVDVIKGGPLLFRNIDSDHFLLYSIGWNGKDDDGRVVQRQSAWADHSEGDWVWKYPES